MTTKDVSIFDITGYTDDQLVMKNKIAEQLKRNNMKSQAYDAIISDYAKLYDKYMASRNTAINREIFKGSEFYKSMSQEDLAQEMTKLKEENEKIKNTNSKNLENLNASYVDLMRLKDNLDKAEKELSNLQPQLLQLKIKNEALTKRNEELERITNKLDSENANYKVKCKKLELDIKTINESYNVTLQENKILSDKIIAMKKDSMDKMSEYTELMKEAQNKMNAADLYFNEKESQYKQTNLSARPVLKVECEEVKIPKKLKYKIRAHNSGITSITFNSFGSNYLTSGADYFIKNWDASKNQMSGVFSGFTGAVNQACFDHTEQFLFAGSMDKTAKLWSLKNNKLISTYTGHIDYINCVGTYYSAVKGLTGSSDRSMKEWDFTSQKMIRNFSVGSACFCLGIAYDDSYVISGHNDGTVKLWSNNDKPEKVFELHDDKVRHIELLRNETQFMTISNDYSIKLFDIRKMDTIYTVSDKTIPQFCQSNISISTDKQYFAIGSNKGQIYILSMKDGMLEETIDNKNMGKGIISISWRPFHSELFVGDENGYLSIWSTETKK